MSLENKTTWTGSFIVMENIQTYDLAKHERAETRFVKLDTKAIHEGLFRQLGVSETVVLLLLASFSDIDNEAYPSQRAIAEMTGLSLPTINRVVNDLLTKEVNGKPILTREFLTNQLGRRFSVYKLNTVDYKAEANQVKVDNLFDPVQDKVTNEVQLESPQETPVDPLTDEKAASDKTEPKDVAPAKKKTARDHVLHFKAKYEDVYGIPYTVHYGRDTSLIKSKLMPVYAEADISYLIDYAIDNYKKEWANKQYPYPSITMLTTWIANAVSQKLKQDEEEREELKGIIDATRGYEDASYDSFDSL